MNTKNLVKRLVSSFFLVSICVYVIFYAPHFMFLLVVEVLALTAIYEYFLMVEKKNIKVNKYLGLSFGGLLILLFNFPGDSPIIAATIFSLFLLNFNRKEESALINVSVTLLGIMYVAWFISYLVKIKQLDNGSLWIFFLILIIKLGDAAAYFGGSNFGKHKLIPHISPNKTVEGAAVGLLVTIVAAVVSGSYLPDQVSWVHLAVMGLVLGVLAQLGDLAESLLKRDVGVKDSGFIPGLGGVLDVLDSLLFTAPFLFYYLTHVLGVQ